MPLGEQGPFVDQDLQLMEQGSSFHEFAGTIILIWFFMATWIICTDWD